MRFKHQILTLMTIVTLLFVGHLLIAAQAPYEHKRLINIDLPLFSFSSPFALVSEREKGIDSAIWNFRNDDLRIIIDLGRYSEKPLIYKDEPGYIEKKVVIDRRKAVIVLFENVNTDPKEARFVAAVYFPKIDHQNTKLSFFAYCKNKTDQRDIERMFHTIKFKKRQKIVDEEQSGSSR